MSGREGGLYQQDSVDGQVFDWRDRQPLIDFYGDSVLVLKF
ncbi:MAG: hypothetical protein QNJ41_29055 [Xenococcaceae cyanobacterium MO_188.B32]|nr:hypothetical protein [Xenococcaceae cyanobacterium MO_188.B32]